MERRTVVLLCLLSTTAFSRAAGPLFTHKDTATQQEFENAYKDISAAKNAGTSLTISSITASTNTWTAGQTFSTANISGLFVAASTSSYITVDHINNKVVPSGYVTCDSDFFVYHNRSGAATYAQIYNGLNTANSAAALLLEVGGTSAGNPYMRYIIDNGNHWATGADNSDSDAFVISNGDTIGTNNVLRAATDGTVTISTLAATGLTVTQTTSTYVTCSTMTLNGNQIKATFGSVNFTLPTAAPATASTILTTDSTQTMNAHLELYGTRDNSAAAQGYFGNEVSSTPAANVNSTGNNQWFDVASFNIDPGEWDLRCNFCFSPNGATYTFAALNMGLTTAGNSSSGQVFGKTRMNASPTNVWGNNDFCYSPTPFSVRVSVTTTLYMKEIWTYSAGTPQGWGYFSARKVR